MKQATGTAKSLGTVLYGKVGQHLCHGVLFRGNAKGRHKKKKRGGRSKDSKDKYYSQKAKQPWFLVSHLPKYLNKPKKIVRLYRLRMQIEEGFRDTKNQQYGIGLGQAQSKSPQRYNNLLLIGALALFVLWCLGQAGVNKKYHYKLQANTVRNKAVLSNIYIAIQIIGDSRYEIKIEEFTAVFESISRHTKKVDDLA